MPRATPRFLSLLLGLVPSLLIGPLRTDDARAAEPPPKGEVTKYTFDQSKIFPGTVRDYWVYVPKQYDPAKPACLYVNQDGIQYNAPAVFDELIHKKEMPVDDRRVRHARAGEGAVRTRRSTASIAATSTTAWATTTPASCSRSCCPRSRRRPTADGRPIRLSQDGNDRASPAPAAARSARSPPPGSGPTPSAASSARSAPTSACAAATSIRRLIRKYEPKPIRIFLQDGSARPEHLRRRLVDGQPGDGARPRPSPATR